MGPGNTATAPSVMRPRNLAGNECIDTDSAGTVSRFDENVSYEQRPVVNYAVIVAVKCS